MRHLAEAAPVVGGCLLIGAVMGLVWWLLAPTATVRRVGDLVVAVDVPELAAAQDGTFVLLAAAAGLVTGSWLTVRPGPAPVARACGLVLGAAAGSVAAWMIGALLGPASVAAQERAGVVDPQSPLDLGALATLGVWPGVAATTAFVGLLVAGLVGGGRRPSHPS